MGGLGPGGRERNLSARGRLLMAMGLSGCLGSGDAATVVEMGLHQDTEPTVRTFRARVDGLESMEATLLRIVVPEYWRIEKGLFAGSAVPTLPLFLNGTPALIGEQLPVWPRYPINVAIHLAGKRVCATTGDLANTAVPYGVEAINAAASDQIFEMREVHGPACRDAEVTVVVGDSIPGKMGEAALYGACGANIQGSVRCYPHWLRSGEINLPSTAAVAEIQHEFLHVLGLNHTCLVPSVMATEFAEDELRSCGLGRRHLGLTGDLVLQRRLSAYDVASIEILRKVGPLVRSVEATHFQWVVES